MASLIMSEASESARAREHDSMRAMSMRPGGGASAQVKHTFVGRVRRGRGLLGRGGGGGFLGSHCD